MINYNENENDNEKYITSIRHKYRSSHQRCSAKKVFLEISQNSQRTPVPRPLF